MLCRFRLWSVVEPELGRETRSSKRRPGERTAAALRGPFIALLSCCSQLSRKRLGVSMKVFIQLLAQVQDSQAAQLRELNCEAQAARLAAERSKRDKFELQRSLVQAGADTRDLLKFLDARIAQKESTKAKFGAKTGWLKVCPPPDCWEKLLLPLH